MSGRRFTAPVTGWYRCTLGKLLPLETDAPATVTVAEFDTEPYRVPERNRRAHRCDDGCACPADGKPMYYSPATGWHACIDGGCTYARPKEDGDG